MEQQVVKYYEVSGTHQEIGRQVARQMNMARMIMPAPSFFTKQEEQEAIALYRRFCPGILEELEAFAEEANASLRDIMYFWCSYLVPGCSSIAAKGSYCSDGHTKIFRNYEFSIEDEDLKLCRTAVAGSYAHIGLTVMEFGRCEGVNECGLAVSMSSCGIPVSNFPGMMRARVKGLQFWAVIRSLLENCRDVTEALQMAKDMPIAFNINLYLADPTGHIALLETMHGEKAVKESKAEEPLQYFFGTNHIVMESFQDREPVAMRNSLVRYQAIQTFLAGHQKLSEETAKDFLLTKYPEGMSAFYYQDWFGTIRSVVLDTVEKRLSICWFGQKENGWQEYYVSRSQKEMKEEKNVVREQGSKEFFEMLPIVQKEHITK